MANIVLISLYDRNAYGQRLMSANLKKHGHRCHMVFLKRYNTDSSYQLELEVGEYPYNPAPLAIVCGAADGSIGDFSLVLLKRTMVDRRR